MNNFPGQGLGAGYTVLGTPLGYAYATTPAFALCKLFGTLLTPEGEPVGSASRAFVGGSLVETWNGARVTAGVLVAVDSGGPQIIGTDKAVATTNELGYFEIYVVRGLSVVVSCPSFGTTAAINTTGLASLDLSTLF